MQLKSIPNTNRILLADDDPHMRKMLSLALTREGYTVVPFTNGHECLIEYESNGASVVLLDCRMPVMDGFTCCHYISQKPQSRYTSIIMITSLNDSRAVDHAFEMGAIDYITKPVHWPVLKQRVRMAVERSQMLHELDMFHAKVA